MSSQYVFAIAPRLEATHGTLYCFEQDQLIKPPHRITFGKKGLSWNKKEGDLCSPAGVFQLGPAFGINAKEVRLPYLLIDAELECVDDPVSRYYNQFVKSSQVEKDWKSSEILSKSDGLYDQAIVIRYNMDPVVPGKGSCIFIHRWRDGAAPTLGCTAMHPKHLQELLLWLDPAKKPLFIQMSLDNINSFLASDEFQKQSK